MKFRTWKPSTTPIHSFFPKNRDISLLLFFTKWTHLKAMMWFENWYLRCLPYQFLLWKQRTRQVKVSRILLAVFISLILPYIVLSCLSLPHLVLPHMILSFRASLQSHHGPCVWPLSETKLTYCVLKKNDIKNYKMHPWQRWLGGFVDCHAAGWLTSLRIGIRFILIILIVLIIFKTCLFFHDHLLQWFDWELTWMWRAVAQWYWNVRQPATVWIWKKMRSGRRNAEISKPILKKQDHLSSWEVVFNAICGWDWDGYQEHLQW